MILAIAQNTPVQLHLREILILKFFCCIAPCLWGLPSLEDSYPNRLGKESDFSDRHVRDLCPICLLDVTRWSTSRIVDFSGTGILSCSIVRIPLLPGLELHKGEIRT